MLGLVLGLPVKGRDGHTGLSLTKGHDQETGAYLIGGKAARDGLSILEKAQCDIINVQKYLMGGNEGSDSSW